MFVEPADALEIDESVPEKPRALGWFRGRPFAVNDELDALKSGYHRLKARHGRRLGRRL